MASQLAEHCADLRVRGFRHHLFKVLSRLGAPVLFRDGLRIADSGSAAYLATSPGGADSVAIIAAASKVDVPFVMAMQTTRLVTVIFLAPILTRYIAELPRSRYS